MSQYSHALWKLKQDLSGPLIGQLDAFAIHIESLGFPRQYLGRQLRVVANFSRWLKDNNVTIKNIRTRHVSLFLNTHHPEKCGTTGEHATLKRLINFLQEHGLCQQPVQQTKQSQVQKAVDDFGCYLVVERNLSPKTRIQYAPTITRFLSERFGRKKINLSRLSAADIISFIQKEASRRSIARAKVATNAMRAFIRYGIQCCDIAPNLSSAVPSVAAWTMTDIPRAISLSDVQAVLSHCPRDTLIGLRDYAILLLLARLGLRSGEIVGLTLDSIDWEAGSIFVAGKLAKSTWLPLPADVGDAISSYLLHGRPQIPDRTLFLRTMAPIGPLGAQQTIATIVNAAIKRAGVSPPTRGSHQFRHALATNLLSKGASIDDIGRILRHRHAKTTNIYTKVHVDALRALSLPWPGGVR